ncbi:MAG: cysteine desulfurase [Saprospiraceae bacterium]|nr:cysteine desulfurase [Saprospiraceae bacterium]
MRIYLDNAATTPICDEVLNSMLPYLKNHFGNPSSTYAEGRTTRAAIERARKTVANALNATSSEIVFTSGGTEANNTALKSAIRDLGIRRIITSPIEHSCVKNTVKHLEHHQEVSVEYVRLKPTGQADLEHLASLLAADNTKTLVTLMHANNEIGALNDIYKIGELCKKHHALFHTDTVQTIGHLPIDVQKLNVDFLSGSAHKLHGPKGVGFLYINNKNQIGCLIDGGGQERQMRSGTENVASIIGFSKALTLAIDELEERKVQIEMVRTYFMEQLKELLPDVEFNGDPYGQYLFTVLSVAIPTDMPLNMLLFNLDLKGISASGGSACSSGSVQGSYVIRTLGTNTAYKTIRFSFSHYNTKEEIDQVIAVLTDVLKPAAKVEL